MQLQFTMKVVQSGLLMLFLWSGLKAQSIPESWDTYVFPLNGRPVSVMLNMALKERATGLNRPYAVILRTKYPDVDASGFPGESDRHTLDTMENQLEEAIRESNGGIYAGRFTQRGLREFYFYVLDTVDIVPRCTEVMANFPRFAWLAKVVYDRNWTNYMEVLYPSGPELEKMENLKMIRTLQKKGDDLSRVRKIEHTLYFRVAANRRSFLIDPALQGFNVSEMPVERSATDDYPYQLIIWKHDKPELTRMNTITRMLTVVAGKYGGRYEGWKTFVSK
jgi:uncharacterized protein (TIGR01619 family)